MNITLFISQLQHILHTCLPKDITQTRLYTRMPLKKKKKKKKRHNFQLVQLLRVFQLSPSIRRGTAGRAIGVSFTFDENRMRIMNDYFPFPNATEKMIYLYKHVFRPSQDDMRTMQAMVVSHPDFRVKDWPSEKDLLCR